MSKIDLIKEELMRVREELKLKAESELDTLGKNMLERTYDIFGKEYPLLAWSERDPDGALAVIIELRKKSWFGSISCFQSGFRLKDGASINLSEAELWEYD
ncbi:hypothetical protein ACJJH9_06895 [Microbulbifer sp. DLAB2-AF]|uniref:hypothetical protein n=1 Tax=Microbulbifer sp. DLAB2-AF TaxID=3243395 RepID=UPI0040393950